MLYVFIGQKYCPLFLGKYYKFAFDKFNLKLVYIKVYNCANKADGRHTFFPKNAKIIATSQHFGKAINKNDCKEFNLTQEQAYKLLDYCTLRFKKEKGSFVRTDGHYYSDNKTDKFRKYCLDKVYIRDLTLEEIIIILTS